LYSTFTSSVGFSSPSSDVGLLSALAAQKDTDDEEEEEEEEEDEDEDDEDEADAAMEASCFSIASSFFLSLLSTLESAEARARRPPN
jgi:TATA-binding protein-associated factor Taf7